jgi:Tfp pilus assembly protein PilN
MTIRINLLPPEYAVSGPLGKLLKTTRMLGVIALGAFLVFALGLAAFFIFSSFQLRALKANEDKLKSDIASSETSEQQIVLLKDRLAKVKIAQSTQSGVKNLEKIDPFIAGLSGSTILTELDVDSQKVDLSILFKSNNELSTFLKTLTDSKVFQSVVLTSFGFNPLTGYLVTIRLN